MPNLHYATLLSKHSKPIRPGQSAALLRALARKPGWDHLHLSPPDEGEPIRQFPCLTFQWHPGAGFSAQCFETARSRSDFLATARSCSKPSVYVDLGGQTQELWPPELFVPLDLASRACEYFVATGRKDRALHWIGISRFPRRTVRRR